MSRGVFFKSASLALVLMFCSVGFSQEAFFKLQPFLKKQSVHIAASNADVNLINLNSNVGAWYLLEFKTANQDTFINIENPAPLQQNIKLDDSGKNLIFETEKDNAQCAVSSILGLVASGKSTEAYTAICGGHIFLKFTKNGYQPTIEKGAQTAREWLGDSAGETVVDGAKTAIRFGRDSLASLKNMFGSSYDEDTESDTTTSDLPVASVAPEYKNSALGDSDVGLKLQYEDVEDSKKMKLGHWYGLQNFTGAYASKITPEVISSGILKSYTDRVAPLDASESRAVVYLMAMDLDVYSLGWTHGTNFPGVGWSDRTPVHREFAEGPDGFGSPDRNNPGFGATIPLQNPGMIAPNLWLQAVGVFAGGFQKKDSAFKYGPYSTTNNGHHYGIIEDGVMMVSMAPDLATAIVTNDGNVEMKTWTPEDDKRLADLRYVRQNGVPLIERDVNGNGIPGKFVKQWGPGNWSGSVNAELRAPRAATCIIETENKKRFLVYAYFSSATPNAMARVFQAYGCNYAIHLDMNSAGQAYGALFNKKEKGEGFNIELLQTSMGSSSDIYPRYLAKPDYKDFFYILKK